MDILSEIISRKRERLAAAQQSISLAGLREQAIALRSISNPHLLAGALGNRENLNIIAEFKRRSPSKGPIRDDADPATIAGYYEAGGAAAISVLTEEDYFNGSLEDLRAVRRAVSLPLLRKDFIFDEYQVYESAAAGADALLLIVAALNDELLFRLRQIAEDELGLDALVEVHAKEEMERAMASGARLIGVNNRNLKTFEVSLETSLELGRKAAPGILLVSESGLDGTQDLQKLKTFGFNGFLIGESLMRSERPDETLRSFVGG